MFGFARSKPTTATSGPQVSSRYCTDTYKGDYPHVGLYDCRESKLWLCKPLGGQAIRTSHARLITGCDNATSTVWKDRFLCFWFHTPDTGEGLVHGHTMDWSEGQLQVRIDPHWDYDRQRLIAAGMASHIEENLQRQFTHGQRILEFYAERGLHHPLTLHFIGQRADDSFFAYKRLTP